MASSLNKALIIGNLTRDPELRQTTSGQSVCTIGVATNRSWNNAQGEKQEQPEYHTVVAWGKLADICGQYLKKGKKVFFEGRLQTRDWEGQDGVRRFRTEIVAENMIMLDRAGAPSGEAFSQPAPMEAPAIKIDEPANDDIKLEDIPF
ncbi:MAG: single-stranded DNA-binding protein [Patescibacteria group bacterium]|jgi:single-strand DNA-binding protein